MWRISDMWRILDFLLYAIYNFYLLIKRLCFLVHLFVFVLIPKVMSDHSEIFYMHRAWRRIFRINYILGIKTFPKIYPNNQRKHQCSYLIAHPQNHVNYA